MAAQHPTLLCWTNSKHCLRPDTGVQHSLGNELCLRYNRQERAIRPAPDWDGQVQYTISHMLICRAEKSIPPQASRS